VPTVNLRLKMAYSLGNMDLFTYTFENPYLLFEA
jgi:hypothetical protein